MSPDKLIYQANQIAKFFHSQPEDRAEGVATHINKYWEPRIRRQFFELIERGDTRFDPLVTRAAALVTRPPADPEGGVGTGSDAVAGRHGGKGTAAGETKSETSVP